MRPGMTMEDVTWSVCLTNRFARRANVPQLISPPNQWLPCACPVPDQEGRFAIVTNVGSGMRWTRHVGRRLTLQADGEVVWFWRPDAGAKFRRIIPAKRRWQESPVTGKSTKDTVKTIAQGMPVDAVYLWLLTRVFFLLHTRPRVQRASGIPCALLVSRVVRTTTRTRCAPRECGLVSTSVVMPRFKPGHDGLESRGGQGCFSCKEPF